MREDVCCKGVICTRGKRNISGIEAESNLTEKRMAGCDVHWERDYRTAGNEKLHDLVVEYIARILNAPKGYRLGDVGCESCARAVRPAKHGLLVRAVDFPETVLERAGVYVKGEVLEDRKEIERGDILSLRFNEMSLDYVLCWGGS